MEIETDQGRAPKLAVSFMGEGGRDGLSGLTLILHPSGKGLAARLERYDRLVYQAPSLELQGEPESRTLVLEYREGKVTATIDGNVIFNRRSLRAIPTRNRLGFMTWGPKTRIVGLELSRPKP